MSHAEPITGDLVPAESRAVTVRQQTYAAVETNYVPALVMSPVQAKALIDQVTEVMKEVMRPGVDYGIIDGCDKPSLYQPGAERLLMMFGLGLRMAITSKTKVDRYIVTGGSYPDDIDAMAELGPGFGYTVKATATKTINGHEVIVAEVEGYAGHDERKWRKAPLHTVLMMAQKRAKVFAARSSCGASDLFTQDVEDMSPEELASREANRKAKDLVVPFDMRSGTTKGTPLEKASDEDLQYLAGRSIEDNKWKAKNEAFRDACQAVLDQRSAAAAPGATTPVGEPFTEKQRIELTDALTSAGMSPEEAEENVAKLVELSYLKTGLFTSAMARAERLRADREHGDIDAEARDTHDDGAPGDWPDPTTNTSTETEAA